MPDAIIADNGNDNHTGDIIDWKEGTLMLKGILHVGLTVTDLQPVGQGTVPQIESVSPVVQPVPGCR